MKKLLGYAKKYDTPLFIYDGDKIIEQYNFFLSSFNVKNIKIHFAAKSLTNINILKLFQKVGAGLDCVSIQEVKIGLIANFKSDDIIYTPNGADFNEYQEAIKYGVKITIDNLSILEKFGSNKIKTPVFLRINPHLLAGGNKNISVGSIDSKFVISIHQLPLAKRIIKKYKINVEGIHVHTGSDIIEIEVFNRISDLIFSIADEFDDIKSIDFDSGFKIKYHPNDQFTDLKKIGQEFSEKFNKYCKKLKKILF